MAPPSNLVTYHYRLIVISDKEDELVFWGPEDNGEHDETIVLKDLRVTLTRCDTMVPGECVLILVKKAAVWFEVLLSRRKPCSSCYPRRQT